MTESTSETPCNVSTPQLLVSVRSAAEASVALAGGCQILDVKDPARGSLGRADDLVIEQVLQTGIAAGVSVSAAMGEVAEYSTSPGIRKDRRLPQSLARLSFTKLGLASLNHDNNWAARWQDTMSFLADGVRSSGDNHAPDWVAVIYADWQAADAPSPNAIVDRVLSTSESTSNHIAGVLIDTWSKKSGRLLDSLTVEQLAELANSVQQSGRFFAVAGRLTSNMLPELASVQPDIVAVRSAACRNEDRTSTVDEAAVQAFRASIDRTFSSPASEQPLSIGVSLE
ncbi:MAG: hypothetical protein ACI92S_004124 [Planctomycetaceae bacterium]|jgi:uncharacterized protein (UPF0264 family)